MRQHPQQDSNPQPSDPKSDALSVELWGQVHQEYNTGWRFRAKEAIYDERLWVAD
jgi:hypothetical protein